ncbi:MULTISPECIES: branched-chain amino acid aminotransferase [unclassified Bosea (in: a-proteobacteria)]|uniref:branched-chain amino acid aminotransferase n=1 Tax=unclassified Bosea (in: a-proteobacteria) TaxID=2653178 RepID=UPI000F75B549|nr:MULTISPECIES: branched-chain amino acid aminotransferase [unclassified Bosea (in: a-proteobacteria)]AZO77788.1 branched chain amino acid aminotransferase [Bosea sp. Tri-49]RXT18404.1 branched chain amino acid aminotransferase [Bosea sp. Tri-39]RXT33001.1 branched chain amino acid aminotransferase [Bosea sp. Tri-54]
MTLAITRTTAPKPIPEDVAGTFGTYFTDHMFLMDFNEARGWHDRRIVPFGPIPIHPCCSAIQYGQSIFDGHKAYRCEDGVVRLFRPHAHIERINKSTARLCMPAVDPQDVLDAMVALVGLDRDWVPQRPGQALYIRETMIGTEGFMAVRPAKQYTFMIFLSPVGAYYAEGADPVKILVSDTYVRAARGGIGAAKAAANYGASLLASEEAKAQGHTQVLWLDSTHRRFIEEVGTMNVMMRIGGEIVTPPLSDSILPGVTRYTALDLLRHWGERVSECDIAIDDLIAGIEDGSVSEMWGIGTAAVVSPIGALTYRGKTVKVADGKTGPVTAKLYREITMLHTQAGRDPYGWRVDVP